MQSKKVRTRRKHGNHKYELYEWHFEKSGSCTAKIFLCEHGVSRKVPLPIGVRVLIEGRTVYFWAYGSDKEPRAHTKSGSDTGPQGKLAE